MNTLNLNPVPAGRVIRGGSFSWVLPYRAGLVSLVLISITLVLFIYSLMAGETTLNPVQVFQSLLGSADWGTNLLVGEVRLPRAVAAWSAGAALGLSGAMLQAITRNRLASPDILGVNDGATFMVMIMVMFASTPVVGEWRISCGGALLAFAILMLLSRNVGSHGHRMLVIGIGVSQLFRSVNELMLSRGHIQHATAVYVWSIGSFVGRGYENALPAMYGLLICVPWALSLQRHINLFSFDETIASGCGVSVKSVKLQTIFVAVISAGLGLSVGGPLAFLALAAPIAVSRLVQSSKVAVVGSLLTGGLLALGGDLAGRMFLAPIELPVGVVCRIFGGLFLLLLLVLPKRNVR
jgi:iron complex transport system permease protein